MKFKSLALIICMMMTGSLFTGCESEEPIIPEVTIPDGSIDYFSEAIDIPASGGSKVITFSTNVDWKISKSSTQSDVSWCIVSQLEGSAGEYGIAIVAEENLGYDDRNVVFLLTAGNITKSIIVNQKQKNAITLTTSRFEVDAKGGIVDVEVKSNVDYKMEIPEVYQSWIKQTSSSRALSTKNLSFEIAESKEYDKREGVIIFSSGDITENVKVYQSGSSILVLSENEFTLGSEGGRVSIDISSNFEFEVDMPQVDWIMTAPKSRAVSSHTLVFDITENTTYDDREAVIIFKDAKGGKKESVTIKQRQKNAIILSKKRIEVSQDGGVFPVDVNSNVDYSIEIPASCNTWISRSNASRATSRGLGATTLSFKVENSSEYDKREGEIYFKYNEVADTLKVYQSGGAILILSETNYELEGGATTINVSLKSNIEYKVSTSADWITEIATRAVSSSTKNFKITTNKTGSSRKGQITFTTSDGSKTATVNVTQASVIEAKSLEVSFDNWSGSIGGDIYIGENYGFNVSVTPANALTDFEWSVENTNIASITGHGSSATLTTTDFGSSKVIVTEKNSGVSASYDFRTAVTNFEFTETSRETMYGYPVVTIAIDGSHQLKYSCTPSYATKIFRDLKALKFKELDTSINTFVLVDKSSIVDIDENGLMTAKKLGTTIIEPSNNCGVYELYKSSGIFVKVVKEITPYGSLGGHEYVDLALPSGKLWSTTNMGSWNDTNYGTYYMWHNNNNVSSSWGSLWSTPTKEEFNELINYCTYTWTTKNGVKGYLFTGTNGATMFLPAAGFKVYVDGYGLSEVQSGGTQLKYWASTKSSYTWEGHEFAFVLSGDETNLTAQETYNTSMIATPIRPIAR